MDISGRKIWQVAAGTRIGILAINLQKPNDEVGATTASNPVFLPRWHEVLRAKYSDPAALRILDQYIFYLKFLKAAHCRVPVESVQDYLYAFEKETIARIPPELHCDGFSREQLYSPGKEARSPLCYQCSSTSSRWSRIRKTCINLY